MYIVHSTQYINIEKKTVCSCTKLYLFDLGVFKTCIFKPLKKYSNFPSLPHHKELLEPKIFLFKISDEDECPLMS